MRAGNRNPESIPGGAERAVNSLIGRKIRSLPKCPVSTAGYRKPKVCTSLYTLAPPNWLKTNLVFQLQKQRRMGLLAQGRVLAPGDRELFFNYDVRLPSRWPSMLISLALHVLAITLAPAAEGYLRLLSGYAGNAELQTFQIVPLRLSEKLYYSPQPPPRPAVQRAASASPASKAPPGPKAFARLSKTVELPPLPEPPKVKSILIQPTLPKAVALAAPLPAIAAWRAPEKAAPKPFVLPGSAKPPTSPAVLDALPSLAKPNIEPQVADINMTGLPSVAAPALPKPPSRTTPVRVFQPPVQSSKPASSDIGWQMGDPAQILALGSTGLSRDTYVRIPELIEKGTVAGPGAPLGGPPGSSGGGGNTATTNGTGGSGAKTGTGTASGSGEAAPRNSTGTAGAGTSSPTAGPAGPGVSLLEMARTPDPPMPGIRVAQVSRAKDGRYGFFVMGSTPAEAFPELTGILSGRIVYTVYLRIGVSRDWILQYCLPLSARGGSGGGSAAARLEAPYAYLMFRPEVKIESADEYFLVRGVVNEKGEFEKLEQVGDAVVAERDYILRVLQRWQFRPATRDGQPVAVEVLLIIPRQEE
mgnify:CR=1 FL=1